MYVCVCVLLRDLIIQYLTGVKCVSFISFRPNCMKLVSAVGLAQKVPEKSTRANPKRMPRPSPHFQLYPRR